MEKEGRDGRDGKVRERERGRRMEEKIKMNMGVSVINVPLWREKMCLIKTEIMIISCDT